LSVSHLFITSFFEKKTPGIIVQVFLSNQIEKPA